MHASVSLILFLASLLAGTWLFVRAKSKRVRGLIVVGTIAISMASIFPWSALRDDDMPRQVLAGGYVSSASCKDCHAEQYSSWHRSYHRSMTQRASPTAVVAPFDGVELQSSGGSFRLERVGDEFYVEMTDPDWAAEVQQLGVDIRSMENAPSVRERILMTTGSHHMQTYWVASGRGNELRQVPWYYHIAEQKWIPAEDSYIIPPSLRHQAVTWNTNCIVCHSVRGRPSPEPPDGILRSNVAELGIACEACHGPGENHVKQHRRSPQTDDKLSIKTENTIVNPAKLSHEMSAEVCGQCHASFSPIDRFDWLANGYRFRPAKMKLSESHKMVPYVDRGETGMDFNLDGFWSDGTQRIGGREYLAMIKSACFVRGELSCLSCHSMHESEPNDQLVESLDEDQACLKCHSDYETRIEQHTHHVLGSSGSKCNNCHMPHTSYALFKAIRSHRIDSPSAANSQRTGRPNACNQCHLDRSLAWTARHLTDWYGTAPVDFDHDDTEIAAAALWVLKGDAVQRAVTAWTLAWQPAVSTSGDDWQPPLLAQLLDDPYSAVRFVAYQSLKKFPGFEDFEYDFVASADLRRRAQQEAVERWQEHRGNSPHRDDGRVLIGPDGQPLKAEVRRLLNLRDDRPLQLPE